MVTRLEMRNEMECIDAVGALDIELREIQILGNYDGEISPYVTWSKACSAVFTLICCS